MTIAACYPSAEGVVFGADSTATMVVSGPGSQPGTEHHYAFCQKIFEFGECGSSVGIITWGMGALPTVSYRTLIAQAADTARRNQFSSLDKVAQLWARMFWQRYTEDLRELLGRVGMLASKGPSRTKDEEREFDYWMRSLSVGFCLGGRWGEDRQPAAFEIRIDPRLHTEPPVERLPLGTPRFWGCPNLINRLAFGIDPVLYSAILESGKWSGTSEELNELVRQSLLGSPSNLPIREAIDFIYARIYTTIKEMKFSHLPPVCGGPIEIAVVTSDRPFRWVCHKRLCDAIIESSFLEAKI